MDKFPPTNVGHNKIPDHIFSICGQYVLKMSHKQSITGTGTRDVSYMTLWKEPNKRLNNDLFLLHHLLTQAVGANAQKYIPYDNLLSIEHTEIKIPFNDGN